MHQKITFKMLLITLEKDGARFYRRMREKVNNQSLKDLFNYLAEEEEHHAWAVEDLFSAGNNNDILDEVITGNMEKISNILIKSPNLDTLEKELNSESAILNYALDIEKKSIDIYTELIGRLSNPDWKDLIQSMLTAEEEHYKNLSALLNIQKRSEAEVIRDSNVFEKQLRKAVIHDEARKSRGNKD